MSVLKLVGRNIFFRVNSVGVCKHRGFGGSSGILWCQQRRTVPLFRRSLPSSFGNNKRFCFIHTFAVSLGQPVNQNCGCVRFRNYGSVLKQNFEMPEKKPFKRLPTNVKPKHYVLVLTPDLKTFTFQGEVTIQIEVSEQVNEIILNAVDIDTKKISLEGSDISNLIPEKIELSKDDETLRLGFKDPLARGTYKLNIVFTGELNDQLRGLYRSKYTSETGEERYAAVTQFEATDARRCFPCWDEPALKATFDISLIVPPKLTALSNMPVKRETPLDNFIRYDFVTTPIMSTYLVAAVVGEYDYVQDRSKDGVLVRVYTPRGKKEQGLFALEVATQVLPYYKEYFDIAYPLPKMDLIAIADFSAGAMENWGLVTYREQCLLVDPKNTSAVNKQWIALVVGHELAHQWFGNLVTMEWWTHLWLNEGYASFVEFLCVNHLFPEYDIWTQFVTETFIRALELDCLQSSHPIEVPVGHPSEVDEIFDDISYNKGAAVIRMLHHYIGDLDFRKGMNLYLTRHQYKNTFTEDLWAALGEASSKPIADVMSTWTKQMGFPVVKAVVKPGGDGTGVILSLSQSKFCADGVQPKEESLWMIPISVSMAQTPGKEVVNTLLNTKSTEVVIPDVNPDEWIKLNPGTVGFYRTQYTPEMLEKFMPAIQDRSLPPLDRLGLLDDLFALVQAGHTSTVEVLKFMKAFEGEVNFTVWCSICNVLSKLRVVLSYTDSYELFQDYEKQLLSKVSKRLGWTPHPGETHLDTLLRGLILGRMAWLDDEHTIKEAKTRFEKHVGSGPTLSADLRGACYRTVLRADGKPVYDSLLNLYRTIELHEEKDRISKAFGAAKDPGILSDVLKFAMSDDVRSQDMVVVIMSVAMTRNGRDLAWKHIQQNWESIIRCQGPYLLTRLVKICENFASNEKADEIEKFFTEKNSPGTERAVKQSVESIRLNAAWLARDSDAIKTYLTENK